MMLALMTKFGYKDLYEVSTNNVDANDRVYIYVKFFIYYINIGTNGTNFCLTIIKIYLLIYNKNWAIRVFYLL